MLGLDLNHMAINKWNPISFGLTSRVEPFLVGLLKWHYIFMFIVTSNNPSALFYIVWIHRMEVKQYGIKILVVT
jgi:hypothetical protein